MLHSLTLHTVYLRTQRGLAQHGGCTAATPASALQRGSTDAHLPLQKRRRLQRRPDQQPEESLCIKGRRRDGYQSIWKQPAQVHRH